MTEIASAHVSVVIAAHTSQSSTSDCIAAHLSELEPGDDVVVVGDWGTTYAGPRIADARVRFVSLPEGTSTPELWSAGILAGRAPIIRLTIAPIIPVHGWRAYVTDAVGRGVVAGGGSIAPADALRLRDWAMLFLRYHRYLTPWARHPSADVPGDHAFYCREALEGCAAEWKHGFWEHDVNTLLAREGHELELAPEFSGRYAGGESARWFIGMRWSHGVTFGQTNAARATLSTRVLHVAVFVLPGGSFLLKILRSILARGGRAIRLALALPWMLVFLGAWALGEWWGWTLGSRPATPDRERASR